MNQLMGFFNGLFSQNNQTVTNNVKEDIIPQEIINQLNYYILLLEHKNKFTSCFLIDLNLNNNDSYYFCTNSNFISQKDIESNEVYDIYLGANFLDSIHIKLDIQQRKIKKFKGINEFILVQIFPELDKIPKEKILTMKSDNLNEYVGSYAKDVYIIGYHNFLRKENSVYNCKIIELIDNYKIKFNSEENSFLGCSPICIINQNEFQPKNKFKIIGIKGEYDILKNNYGFLLGRIINSLEDFKKVPNQLFNNIMNNIIENDNNYNINNEIDEVENLKNEILVDTIGFEKIDNVDTNIKTEEMKLLQNYYFYTFKEYKKTIIKFHNLISKYYVSQSKENFNYHYSKLQEYLKKYPTFVYTNQKFLDNLQYFSDPKNYENLMPDKTFTDFNRILSSSNLELIEKFSYFIAGLMLALYTYGTVKRCVFVNDGNVLYKRVNLNYEDIKRLESNKDNIILFKTFLKDITTVEHLQGIIYKNKIDADFVKKNNKFDTKINIIHNFDESSWFATCFSLSTFFFPEKIFNLFSFFKVIDVDINYDKKEVEVTLQNVGIKNILEVRIAELNDKFTLEYNRDENVIEVF